MATLCIQERTIGAKMGQWMHSLITSTIKMVYFWVSFERYHCLDDQEQEILGESLIKKVKALCLNAFQIYVITKLISTYIFNADSKSELSSFLILF